MARFVRPSIVFVPALLACLLLQGARGEQARRASFPRLEVTPRSGTEVVPGELVRIRVHLSDSDGETVSLRMPTQPPGLDFRPFTDVLPPVQATFEWAVPSRGLPGRTVLTFEAEDASGRVTEIEVAFRIRGSLARVTTGDVTGDGIADLVAAAREADHGGFTNSGAVHVWAGARQPGGVPTAVLTASELRSGDRVGHDGIQLADVTGDGVLDVLAGTRHANSGGVRDSGAIHVWAGGPGLVGPRTQTALLASPSPTELLQLHEAHVVDVTGDGLLDVVVPAGFATVAGSVEAGATFVWAGGQGLGGAPPPTATLTALPVGANDEFGIHSFVDLSGDGILDLVGGSRVDVGGVPDLGAAFVFLGGPGLVGDVAPVARLATAYLGTTGSMRFAEVTGDGITDAIAVVQRADVAGAVEAGALVVWAGGTLSGDAMPRAVLAIPGASAGDRLGSSVRFEDVTGDGVTDLVASAFAADDAGLVDVGGIWIWRGGPRLRGLPAPRAVLRLPGAMAEDHLAALDTPFVDLTGDGVVDVLAFAAVDEGAFVDTGAILVWQGGASLTGAQAPRARLQVPSALPGDFLGNVWGRHGVRAADLDGDGVPELVVGASGADGQLTDFGAVYVFPDGAALSGNVAPRATLLVPVPEAGDGFPSSTESALHFADVSGDGVLDLIAGSHGQGLLDTGVVLVWFGGTLSGTPPPDAELSAPRPMQFDYLGIAGNAPLQLADLTRDGVLDLVVGGEYLDGATLDSGVVCVWRGGPGLAGQPAPIELASPPTAPTLYLGADALLLADLSGDGHPDLVAGTSLASPNGVEGAGALLLWSTPLFTGAPQADAVHAVPTAAMNDHLGG